MSEDGLRKANKIILMQISQTVFVLSVFIAIMQRMQKLYERYYHRTTKCFSDALIKHDDLLIVLLSFV